MARATTQLTNIEIKNAEIKDKNYKISDGAGLYLVIKKNGTKFFRFDFSFGMKRKSMSFGIFPTISLKNARDARDAAKKLLTQNINPINAKNAKKEKETLTFSLIINKWLDNKKINERTKKNYKDSLNKNVTPYIGSIEIINIKRVDIVNLLEIIIKREEYETTKRMYRILKEVYSWAVLKYNLEYNIIDFNINDLLQKKVQVKNHTAIIEKEEITLLINDIKRFKGDEKDYLHYVPVYALKMIPYLFMRVSAFIQSEWEHIDFENDLWYFPAQNMKTKNDYVYPIPKQVKELLLKLKENTVIESKYILHSPQNRPNIHLNRVTLLRYLTKELGYKDKMTLHGFRSTFSTTCYEHIEEHGYDDRIIEACLSHEQTNKTVKSYNRENKMKYIKQKRELIQWYSNWLDNL